MSAMPWEELERPATEARLNGAVPDAEPDPADAGPEIGWEDMPDGGNGADAEPLPDPALWPDVCTLELSRREYVVQSFIPAGTLGMVTSGPGEGKSFVLLNLACHVATGATFAGMATYQRPVLYLDAENPPHEIKERLTEGFGLIGTPPGLHIAGTWNEFAVPNPVGGSLQRWILQCEPKPLIFMDTLSDFTGARDENDAATNGKYLTALRALVSAGATVVLLHHVPKAKTAPYRGNSIILGKVDYAYELVNPTPGATLTRVQLRAFKRRVSVPESLWLDWNPEQGTFDAVQFTQAETNSEVLARVIAQNPGLTKKDLLAAATRAGVAYHRAIELIGEWKSAGKIRVEKVGCAQRHYLEVSGCEYE